MTTSPSTRWGHRPGHRSTRTVVLTVATKVFAALAIVIWFVGFFSGRLESSAISKSLKGNVMEKKKCLQWPLEEELRTLKFDNQKGYRRGWADLVKRAAIKGGQKELRGAEVGVFEGDMAAEMLKVLTPDNLVSEYILVDPWRHLDNWNKPFNKEDDEFERIFKTAMSVTKDVYGDKVTVLRHTSYKAAQQIPDESLDFIYIDGDHTAKGAMKDLLLWAPKVKCGGLISGDDFVDSFQHGANFDPTMVKSAVMAYSEAFDINVYEKRKQFGFVAK